MTSTPVVVSDMLPDGRRQGFASDGTLIVDIEFLPVFKYLVGDPETESCVTKWVVSPQYARRVAAMAAWQLHDNACIEGVQ